MSDLSSFPTIEGREAVFHDWYSQEVDRNPDEVGELTYLLAGITSSFAVYDPAQQEIDTFGAPGLEHILPAVSLTRVAMGRPGVVDVDKPDEALFAAPREALHLTTDDDLRLARLISERRDRVVPSYLGTAIVLAVEYMDERFDPTEPFELGSGSPQEQVLGYTMDTLNYLASPERFSVKDAGILELLGVVDNEEFNQRLVQNNGMGADLRLLISADTISDFARQALDIFGRYTPKQLRKELDGLMASYVEANTELFDVPIESTGWEILPIGELEDHIEAKSAEIDHDSLAPNEYYDWNRIRRLAQLIRSLYSDGSLYVRDGTSLGSEEYYVAELPTSENGGELVHAVADNPRGPHNAMYVWRAEKGIEDGRIARSWKQVLIWEKLIARGMGAKSMRHTDNLEERLEEYLTRKTERLDDPHYDL